MYLNLIEIAESFGVSETVIEGWIRNEGLPHTPDRGRLLFDRAQVADWAAKRGLAAKAGFMAPEASPLGTALQLGPLVRTGGIWRDVAPEAIPQVLARIVAALPGVNPAIAQLLGQRVRMPGGVTMAPVGEGFALPHLSSRVALGRDSGVVALLLLREALPAAKNVPDEVPVTRLLFFIAPSPRLHLDLLARLSRGLSQEPLRERLRQGAPDASILEAIDALDARLAVEPPAKEVS